MARTEHGTIPETGLRQPGGTLVYDYGGLIEGNIGYIFDEENHELAISKIGQRHPDDSDVFIYAARISNDTNGLLRVDYDCIGIDDTRGTGKTTPSLSFPNSVSTEPIQTHPCFRVVPSRLYGRFTQPLGGYGDVNASNTVASAYSGQNSAGSLLTTGARWQMGSRNATTGKSSEVNFMGFIGPEAPEGLAGVTSYYVGNPMCNVTYYTNNTPTLKGACTIQDPEAGDIPSITGGTQWMHLISSAEQIGKVNIWRVVEQFISGRNISDYIYAKGLTGGSISA